MADQNQQSTYRPDQRIGYDLEDRFDQESGYRGGRGESEWGREELGRPWDGEQGYRNEGQRYGYGQQSQRQQGPYNQGQQGDWRQDAARYGREEYRQENRFGQLAPQQRRGSGGGMSNSYEEQQWRDSGQNPAGQRGDWREQQEWRNSEQYGRQPQRYGEGYHERPMERSGMNYRPDYGPYGRQSPRYGGDQGSSSGRSSDHGWRSAGDGGSYGEPSSSGQGWQQQFGQPPRSGNPGDYARYGYEGGPGFQSRQQDRYGGYYGQSAGLADQERWPTQGPHAGKGPKDYQRSDDAIRDDVCETLTRHGNIDASDINVSVHNGEVTVSGNVPDKHMRREVEDVLDDMSGVKDVNNQLRINNRPAYDVIRKEPSPMERQQQPQSTQSTADQANRDEQRQKQMTGSQQPQS
jgi:hypothetical protein